MVVEAEAAPEAVAAGEVDGRRPVAGLAHDVKSRVRVEQGAESRAYQLLVVDDRDPDHGRTSHGKLAVTRKPSVPSAMSSLPS